MRHQLLLGERDGTARLALMEDDRLGTPLLRGDAQHARLQMLQEEVGKLLERIGHERGALDAADEFTKLLLPRQDAHVDVQRLHELARRTGLAARTAKTAARTPVVTRTAKTAARTPVVTARTTLVTARASRTRSPVVAARTTLAEARPLAARGCLLTRLETRELRRIVRLALCPGGCEIERTERAQIKRTGVLLGVFFSHAFCLSGIPSI